MPDDRSDRLQVVKEVLAAFISVSILVVSMLMLVRTFEFGRQPFVGTPEQIKAAEDSFGRQKDLLLYALALLGTVTGYYLGRVPAELHAKAAEKAADKAAATATAATVEKERVKKGATEVAKRTLRHLGGAQPLAKTLGSGTGPPTADVEAARRELTEFLETM